jgi:hypothetical protein
MRLRLSALGLCILLHSMNAWAEPDSVHAPHFRLLAQTVERPASSRRTQPSPLKASAWEGFSMGRCPGEGMDSPPPWRCARCRGARPSQGRFRRACGFEQPARLHSRRRANELCRAHLRVAGDRQHHRWLSGPRCFRPHVFPRPSGLACLGPDCSGPGRGRGDFRGPFAMS